MTSPHALVVPFVGQGHVLPLLSFSRRLVEFGFKITFANTKHDHARVLAVLQSSSDDYSTKLHGIRLVSIPDGSDSPNLREDLGKVAKGFVETTAERVKELILKINESEGDKLTCMIADGNMGWLLPVAKKMGLRVAMFWPASAAMFAIMSSIPRFIEEGILCEDGLPKEDQTIQLSPGMPPVRTTQFAWNCVGTDAKGRRDLFDLVTNNVRGNKEAGFILCNSFLQLEEPTFSFSPNVIPIGPLLVDKQIGHFFPEDETCMAWLEGQPPNSVIYVSFGSLAVINWQQFQELALGLELTGRPFLWVVRPDLTDGTSIEYPDGFWERTAGRGKTVGWTPQQKVLAHPSVACFVSHCGWNSTLEGVCSGVPFLCWPYFTDQFLNETYVCDVWRTGLRIRGDESGVIPREEIKKKVEDLLGDVEMKARVSELKSLAVKNVGEGGVSVKNFKRFVDAMKK